MNDTIYVVEDFGAFPYGRYKEDGDYNGQKFRRQLLAPRLRDAVTNGYKLTVILDGYNRYGPSFLDEAFGGLIREDGFTKEQIDEHLAYSHSLVKSIETLITQRINASAGQK